MNRSFAGGFQQSDRVRQNCEEYRPDADGEPARRNPQRKKKKYLLTASHWLINGILEYCF